MSTIEEPRPATTAIPHDYSKRLMVFGGRCSMDLAAKIAGKLDLDLGQADLKTFSALGAYGMTVITALVAQTTTGVRAIHEVPAEFVTQQLDTLLTDAAAACRIPVPAGAQGLTAYPVSKDVGNVRNNAPYLVEPAPAGGADPEDVPTLF